MKNEDLNNITCDMIQDVCEHLTDKLGLSEDDMLKVLCGIMNYTHAMTVDNVDDETKAFFTSQVILMGMELQMYEEDDNEDIL